VYKRQLGVPGKTGCLVCHGDPKISQRRGRDEDESGLYISDAVMAGSVHKNIACTSCHTDFKVLTATQDHKGKTGNYKVIAGLSCKNCHRHSKQLVEYGRSIHGRLALSGNPEKGATCADCHGSHDIRSMNEDKAYAAEFHLSGSKICGKCHKDYADSYNDYYHGKAYNQKAQDAPACWDCHGAHDVLPSDVLNSRTSPSVLPQTCGKCHIDSREEFAAQYGGMIHGSKKIITGNFVSGNILGAWSWISENVFGKIGDYYNSVVTSLFERDRN
jgi:nitrate/TMAO reductase-like tetraheme cytochrome c subunit